MQGLEADIGTRRLPLVRLEQARRGTGGAGEQIGVPGSLADHGLQQLAHDAERERLLELRAPRLERPDAGLLGRRARLAHELGLADAGRPLDQEQRPLPGARALKAFAQRPELALALAQSAP